MDPAISMHPAPCSCTAICPSTPLRLAERGVFIRGSKSAVFQLFSQQIKCELPMESRSCAGAACICAVFTANNSGICLLHHYPTVFDRFCLTGHNSSAKLEPALMYGNFDSKGRAAMGRSGLCAQNSANRQSSKELGNTFHCEDTPQPTAQYSVLCAARARPSARRSAITSRAAAKGVWGALLPTFFRLPAAVSNRTVAS